MSKSKYLYALLLVPLAAVGIRFLGNKQPQAQTPTPYLCDHQYSTEIVSLDPLVIYINDFISSYEIDYLLNLGEPLFQDSILAGKTDDRKYEKNVRSSSSAFLPLEDTVTKCIGQRALNFLGFLEHEAHEPIQLVRYYPGQQFTIHSDWFGQPFTSYHAHDAGRKYNRLASFFAYLGDNCTGGETWFPYIDGTAGSGDTARFAVTEDKGLSVKPVKGNALFWMNLHKENSTGDVRVKHAGVPIDSGVKYGMNIWTKHYES